MREDVGIAAAGRRRVVTVAGHRGDVTTARRFLKDPAPSVRAAALSALARANGLTDEIVVTALVDPEPNVRRRAAELAVHHPGVPLSGALADPDGSVAEVAAWATGERDNADPGAVRRLVHQARHHPDPLCREAAVAALGSLAATGAPDDRGGRSEILAAILAATADKPAVRRRAVLGLASFDGPEVEAALLRARADRDWQVRQAAEDLGS